MEFQYFNFFFLSFEKKKYLQPQIAILEVSITIFRGKGGYHSRVAKKLIDTSESSRTFWYILKRFYNVKKYQLFHHYWSVARWNQNSKPKQTILTASLLQKLLPLLTAGLHLIRHDTFQTPGFPSFFFSKEVILKILNALNIIKAHRHRDTSVLMIKLCSKSLVKPLSAIFSNFIGTGTFLDI